MKLISKVKKVIRLIKMHCYYRELGRLTDMMEYYELEGKQEKVHKCVKEYNRIAAKYEQCKKAYNG